MNRILKISMINIDGASYLDVQEAAVRLGVKPETLYAYVSRGMLRSYKQGIRRRRLYLQSEIEALLTLRPPEAEPAGREAGQEPLPSAGESSSPVAPPPVAPQTEALPHADEWAAER